METLLLEEKLLLLHEKKLFKIITPDVKSYNKSAEISIK